MGHSGAYRIRHSQNFLRKSKLVDRLVRQAGIDARDIVVEIGAGDGKLTSALARRAGQVIAIEQDARLVGRLSERFGDDRRVCVFGADALEFPLPSTPYKVFANIPFRHTSGIIGKLTTGVAPPVDTWLIVQKEAAERYVPDGKATMVAIALAPWFDISIEHRFQRRDFQPAPRVESVLLRLRRRPAPLLDPADRDRFVALVEAGFTAWQPTVREALSRQLPRNAATHITSLPGLELGQQPSATDVALWVAVYKSLAERDDPLVWKALGKASDQLRRQQASIDRRTQTAVGRKRG